MYNYIVQSESYPWCDVAILTSSVSYRIESCMNIYIIKKFDLKYDNNVTYKLGGYVVANSRGMMYCDDIYIYVHIYIKV